jgi:LSD1 subclass zinc finger protein
VTPDDASPTACTLCPEPRAAHRPLSVGDGAGRARCAACGAIGRPHARLEGDSRGNIIYLCPNRHHTVAALRYDRA